MKKKAIGVGVGVMILKGGKVLLGKRNYDAKKATSLLKGAGTWTMPGGKQDFGEGIIECARRETLEETGLILNKVEVICINNDVVEDAHFVTIGLLCEEFEGEPKVMEPEKITGWQWFALDKLPQPMYFPSRKVIENYRQKKFCLEN